MLQFTCNPNGHYQRANIKKVHKKMTKRKISMRSGRFIFKPPNFRLLASKIYAHNLYVKGEVKNFYHAVVGL